MDEEEMLSGEIIKIFRSLKIRYKQVTTLLFDFIIEPEAHPSSISIALHVKKLVGVGRENRMTMMVVMKKMSGGITFCPILKGTKHIEYSYSHFTEEQKGFCYFHYMARGFTTKEITYELRDFLERAIEENKKRASTRLKMSEERVKDEEFKKKYPRVFAGFEFWKNLYSQIESKIKDTIIFETDVMLLPPAAMDVTTFPGKVGIRVRKDIAEELEDKGYFLTAYGRKESLDELMFHEFLHVLCEYKPELFRPHPLVIDFVPARVTHFKPPKTKEGILERIKIINKWWERYAEEEYPARRYAWLKKKYATSKQSMVVVYRGVPYDWEERQRPENDIDVQWTKDKVEAALYGDITEVDIEEGTVGYVLIATVPKSWLAPGEAEGWFTLSNAPKINRLKTPNIPPSVFAEGNGYVAKNALDFWIENDLNRQAPPEMQLNYTTRTWKPPKP